MCDAAQQDEHEQGVLRDDVKRRLKAQLPDYMVPAHLMLLPGMPLTANGKLDRRALPTPDIELNRQQYVAPSNPLQHRLAQVWCDVLNLTQVGLNDNFFELGGDLDPVDSSGQSCPPIGDSLPARGICSSIRPCRRWPVWRPTPGKPTPSKACSMESQR